MDRMCILKIHLPNRDLDYTIPKGISQAKSQIYILEKEITSSREIFAVLILKYQSPSKHYYCYFIFPFGNILFPIL
jgi:hypothetical protein